jgi:hypothetical protein
MSDQLPPNPLSFQPPEPLTIALPSARSLFLKMKFGDTLLAKGTGFVVRSPSGPLLITNRHNVSGRSCETGQPISPTGGIPGRLEIMHHRRGALGQWVQRTEPVVADGRPLWFEHPRGAQVDVVALRLTQLCDVDLFPYPLTNRVEVRVAPADIVSVIGFPFGLGSGGFFAIWATGFVASEPEVDHNGLPLMLIDCRARQGQSGSAVVAYRRDTMVNQPNRSVSWFEGEVIHLLGIYSGRVNKDSDLGYVWKLRAIRDLIACIAIPTSFTTSVPPGGILTFEPTAEFTRGQTGSVSRS